MRWGGEGSVDQGRDPIPEARSAGWGGHPEVPPSMPGALERQKGLWWHGGYLGDR